MMLTIAVGTPQSSIEMQGEMVQSAVLNLPEVVNEVFQMQKGQSSEIMKQKNILEALKVSFHFSLVT